MLRAQEARDFVILEKTALEFGPGFSVLTGETGAGKSILVDAIELLVGGRGDGALVREGAERAELSAEFEVEQQSSLSDWLTEMDLAGDPGTVLLRRSIERSGRSRCFINGH
ncbi:MAG TPA: AAA family ATPase, partial [Burkholderiales bacterium]|nr:AAA family ATPase [Burkholderiales bacterium]